MAFEETPAANGYLTTRSISNCLLNLARPVSPLLSQMPDALKFISSPNTL